MNSIEVVLVGAIGAAIVSWIVSFFLGRKTRDDFLLKEDFEKFCSNCAMRNSGTVSSLEKSYVNIMEELKNIKSSQYSLRENLPLNYVRIDQYRNDLKEIKDVIQRLSQNIDKLLEMVYEKFN